MANKILVARGTKARIEEIKSTLADNELVYSTDTGELGVKKANGNIEYFMNAADIIAIIDALETNKIDKVEGKGLSANDYTDNDKNKLAGIEEGAEVNPYSKTELDNKFNDKVDKETGKGLSTNDFTSVLKTKLDGIEEGAQVNPYSKTQLDDKFGTKVDKVSGKGLSDNNYTTVEKNKLESIEEGAEVNTVLSVAGKTGEVVLNKTDIGLGSVDNTADLAKPISTATQTALNLKANKTELNDYVTASVFDMQMLEKLGIKPNGTDLLIIDGMINPLYIDDASYKVNHPTVNSQAAMLALDVPPGTVVVRLDTPSKELFILTQLPASTLANWQVVSSNTVVSVAGKTGAVVLGITDISGLNSALNLKLDITTFEAQLTQLQADIATKVDKVSGKGLSTNDYSDVDKAKVDKISTTGSAATYLNATGAYTTPPNTTYSSMSLAEGQAATVTTGRIIASNVLKSVILHHSPAGARPASDVSAWAKAANKPTYTAAEVGLGNVNNTSDLDKPISTATQTALDNKVDKVTGKGLSTNDYTTTEKNKLAGIASGAEVNVQSNWNATSGDALILNKPYIPSKVSDLTNDTGYITGYTETDPIFTAWNKSTGISITKSQVSDLIEATQALSGLMSATDKERLDVLHSLLEEDTENSVVDSINEVLAIFNNYPEGADLVTALAGKVDKVNGKGLSTKDFTAAHETKLNGIATGAQVNVQSDWNATTGDAFIKNKPTTFTPSSHTHTIANITGLQTALDGKAATSHTHDDRYYTESETDTLLSTKAAKSHTHTKSQITDFPTSMPASDVSAWAKAAAKPTYTATEVGARPAGDVPWAEVSDKPNFSTVATSGSYNDLSNTPTIPTIPSVMTTTEGNTGTATTQRTVNAANLKEIILNHSPAGSRPASDVSSWAKASSKPTYTWSEITSKPTFATVATTGSYNDLSNTPTIPTIPSVMTTTEGNTGTATTQRTVNAANLKEIILNHSPAGARTPTAHTHTKAQITDFAHTHTKAQITDFAHNHDDRYYTEGETNTLLNAKLSTSLKGAVNGLAELGSDGKVPSSQLPSYVDDVLEYTSFSSLPTTGESGKIYISQDTNKTYRWSGSGYTEISASLALGETSSTAGRGDWTKTAYDHTSLTNNPHSVTKAQVGLSNVDNTSDANKPISTAQQTALDGKENSFTKNTAFNKNFGTTAGTVAQGNHNHDTVYEPKNTNIQTHIGQTNNPHSVTKTQVGLGSVSNYGLATKVEAQAGTSNIKYMTPLRTAEAIAALAPAEDLSAYNTHIASVGNPHSVTKAQVGLGSVLNYGLATQAEAKDGTSNVKYMTPLRVAEAIATLAPAEDLSTLNAHVSSTNNPHSVTKTQVGLGNVDNTSDLNKPISTATQSALDDKVDKNIAITAGTKTKITYDEKGLVTGGSDLVPSDIGAVEEALNDGKTYARKNKSWVEFQRGFLPDEETITLNNDDELEATNVAIWRYE